MGTTGRGPMHVGANSDPSFSIVRGRLAMMG